MFYLYPTDAEFKRNVRELRDMSLAQDESRRPHIGVVIDGKAFECRSVRIMMDRDGTIELTTTEWLTYRFTPDKLSHIYFWFNKRRDA